MIRYGGYSTVRLDATMDTIENRSEVFWMAFSSLSKKERQAVVERLLKDPEFREDLMDIAVFEQRKYEPSRPFREYLEERGINREL